MLTAGVVAANAQRNAEDEIVNDIARRRGRRGGRDAEASPLRVVRFRRDQTIDAAGAGVVDESARGGDIERVVETRAARGEV